MASFKKESKELVFRGNVMDMAVGIIIGGALDKTVSLLVDDTLTSTIRLFTGGINFTELVYEIKSAEFNESDGKIVSVTTLNCGLFVQSVVDFLTIILAVFIMTRVINNLRRKYEELVAPTPEPSDEVKLLTEIRNLLDKKQ